MDHKLVIDQVGKVFPTKGGEMVALDRTSFNLPRPRDYKIKNSSEFLSLKTRLLGLIREETLKAIK